MTFKSQNVFSFPIEANYSRSPEYVRYSNYYNYAFLSKYESNEEKIRNFREKVFHLSLLKFSAIIYVIILGTSITSIPGLYSNTFTISKMDVLI
jgi:hypothetical protein